MQHKCVEMSLQITTGLAVGVFAVMYHELPNSSKTAMFSSPHAKVCLVIVIELYTILQLLILANYLYHSFLANILTIYLAELDSRHVKAIHKSLLHKLHTTPKRQEARRKICAYILNRFQPLIIYFSAFIGIVACFGSGLWLFFPPIGFWLRWPLVVIPGLFFFLLCWMCLIHTLLDPLARTRIRVEIKQGEETNQSSAA